MISYLVHLSLVSAQMGLLTHYWDCTAPACAYHDPGNNWKTYNGKYTFSSAKSFTKTCQQDTVTTWTFDHNDMDQWSPSVNKSQWSTKAIDETTFAYSAGLGNKDWCPAPIGVGKDNNKANMPWTSNGIGKENPAEYSYSCQDMNPWKKGDTWYGYVAVAGTTKGGNCGKCLEVNLRNNPKVNKMLVQIINTGDSHPGNLDLLVAGGGTGAYPWACSAVWSGDLFDINSGACSNGGWQCATYGGFNSQSYCDTQFEQHSPNAAGTQMAKDACNNALFGDLFFQRDWGYPTNPEIDYWEVDCPLDLICKSEMYPEEWSIFDIKANCGGSSAPTTQVPTEKPTTTTPEDSCPLDTPCWHGGWNTSCGDRIQWLVDNIGLSREDAGDRVAGECDVCKGCESIKPTTQTTTTQTTTTQTTTTQTTTTQEPVTTSDVACPFDTNCLHAGVNATCGARIDWVITNMGMTRAEAGDLVAGECDACRGCASGPTTQAPTTTSQNTVNPNGIQQLNQRCGEVPFGNCNPELVCKGKSLKLCVKPDTHVPKQFHEQCSDSEPCSSHGLKCQKIEGQYSECIINPDYSPTRGLRGAFFI